MARLSVRVPDSILSQHTVVTVTRSGPNVFAILLLLGTTYFVR